MCTRESLSTCGGVLANERSPGLLPSAAVGPNREAGTYLLAFVTTSCQVCRPVWEMLASVAGTCPVLPVPVIVVTPSRSLEDERRAHQLAPPGALLHMSSDTWFMYGVAQAGTFLLVRQAAGAAVPWEEPAPVLGHAVPADIGELTRQVEAWLSAESAENAKRLPGAAPEAL